MPKEIRRRRRKYHDKPTANQGNVANPLRTINHRLPVTNGGKRSTEALWNTPWFVDFALLVRWRLTGNGELNSNTFRREQRMSLCSPKKAGFGSQRAV
ncbi:hypothetical protein AVEN_87145-1 [Araneus ventricosus]|uniref:Uncharacterized protein n=1 Tax=Araneus ventricosus TaxID=182803 RepID=A0A4Y2PTK8_ARAVE|nr:hypothetical protein AVEN_39621-1 [Araneus ventricosus]GBN53456.1 hypothetical protein AVEN_133431-1 [Araneus ventricosus]GBN53612.1 hypothetical protein AVEN_87145-1 [Araneus ventricosus]